MSITSDKEIFVVDSNKKKITKSISTLNCVANTNTPGAAGKVPYRNPYVLKSRVSVSFTPGLIMLTTSLTTSGRVNLKEIGEKC